MLVGKVGKDEELCAKVVESVSCKGCKLVVIGVRSTSFS